MGLLVPWQGPCGQTAQPMPTPGLAPGPAHTLSRGLGNTGSEFPTIPSSPSDPAHLLSERNLHKFKTHTSHRTEIVLSGAQQDYLIHSITAVLDILYTFSTGHSVLGVPADVIGRDVL